MEEDRLTEARPEQVEVDVSSQALSRHMDRRSFLRLSAAGAGMVMLGGALAACNLVPGAGSGRTIRIGWVSPRTGPLAGFGEADDYVLNGVREAFGSGLAIGNSTFPVEILTRDSQSDPNRAASVAGELISSDGIDLMLVASTPETTNPVADQCEANGIPCISSVAPWQPYVFGRQPNVPPPEAQPFQWTYHFFWGLEDIIAVFLNMWSQLETNAVVGAIWPNDGDGNAWSSPEVGFPPAFSANGYSLVDPGRYENLTDDFSAQIAAFRNGNAQIVTGVPIPPDFTTFWTQALQQGFRPRVASIGKALLFPASVEALGETNGDGLSTEVWWSPSHPFSSSLTQQSARDLADGYTESTQRQWTQPIGFAHALFEVAADALRRASDIDDKASIRDAIRTTNLNTIVGRIDWSSGPFPNVAKTPLVGGQWGPGEDFPYDLTIVSNEGQPDIPKVGDLRPIPGSS
ncbi:MAG TPA: ABC transporter substrate-binding protein [Candidatus Limnocylindria bacterium]|nr:ABC transporter substrate-binding protein [Candidatus Limnocylindria bacterium]